MGVAGVGVAGEAEDKTAEAEEMEAFIRKS